MLGLFLCLQSLDLFASSISSRIRTSLCFLLCSRRRRCAWFPLRSLWRLSSNRMWRRVRWIECQLFLLPIDALFSRFHRDWLRRQPRTHHCASAYDRRPCHGGAFPIACPSILIVVS